MKNFLVRTTLVVDGYEHDLFSVVHAESRIKAAECAIFCQTHNSHSLDWCRKDLSALDDSAKYIHESSVSISAEQVNSLKALKVPVFLHSQADLMGSGNYKGEML